MYYVYLQDGSCSFDQAQLVAGTHVENVYAILQNDEGLLKDAVANIGPVIVAMDINPEDFMSYSKGPYITTLLFLTNTYTLLKKNICPLCLRLHMAYRLLVCRYLHIVFLLICRHLHTFSTGLQAFTHFSH